MKTTLIKFLACCLLISNAAWAQTSTLEIARLSWLQGTWITTQGKQIIDEHWSLEGQSLLGVSRTMEDEHSRAVEMMMLEKNGQEFIMRLRFFGPAIDKATRGKDQPLRLQLVEADAVHFLCLGIESEEGTRLSYTLTSPTTLHAIISKTKDGKVVWQEEFSFTRRH
ncbi:MAG: hypothetical protein K2P84_11735 [Undibacterium sp.]|nr:hypothetical protein [Undibacterium sp.]